VRADEQEPDKRHTASGELATDDKPISIRDAGCKFGGPMESQPEGMHPEHRQFRQYVIRRRTGRNYLRIRASIETIRCLAGAIFVRGFADLVTKNTARATSPFS
jgi:hypothetical protein